MSVHTWGESPHGDWQLEIHNEGRYMGKSCCAITAPEIFNLYANHTFNDKYVSWSELNHIVFNLA